MTPQVSHLDGSTASLFLISELVFELRADILHAQLV